MRFPLLWSLTDLDQKRNWVLLILIRVIQAVFFTYINIHPDEYWQATQPAYNWVYGNVQLPWEWHDKF